MPKRNQQQAESNPPTSSKADLVLAAVDGKSGATLSDLVAITGWQAHSVRATLSRLRQRGYIIELTTNRAGIAKYHVRKVQ